MITCLCLKLTEEVHSGRNRQRRASSPPFTPSQKSARFRPSLKYSVRTDCVPAWEETVVIFQTACSDVPSAIMSPMPQILIHSIKENRGTILPNPYHFLSSNDKGL